MRRDGHDWTKQEVEVIKSAWGTDLGRMALEIVMTRLGDIHGQPVILDALLLAHHAGRRYVAIELKNAITKPAAEVAREPDEPRSNRPLTATERAERTGG